MFGFCFLPGFIKADYRRQNAEKKVHVDPCIIRLLYFNKLKSFNLALQYKIVYMKKLSRGLKNICICLSTSRVHAKIVDSYNWSFFSFIDITTVG